MLGLVVSALLLAYSAPLLAPARPVATARVPVLAMGEAADMVMAAETPEELLIDLLRTVEAKNVDLADQIRITEELTRTVSEKGSTIEEVVAELKAAQEEIDSAELVANQLSVGRQ